MLPAVQQAPLLAPRRAAPCDVEIMALVQLSAVPVLLRLQDGNKLEVSADSWTSVSDLEKQASFAVARLGFAATCRYHFPAEHRGGARRQNHASTTSVKTIYSAYKTKRDLDVSQLLLFLRSSRYRHQILRVVQ